MQRPRLLCGVLCLAALAAATGLAQSAGTLEIRGAVLDPFLGNIGVPGASVTVTEFSVVDNLESRIPVATSATDAQGSFVFHPDHFGRYLIEVHRDGYVIVDTNGFADPSAVSKQTGTTLDREHTSQEVRFTMTRPGELTGRVMDEDGQPVANLRIAVQAKSLFAVAKPILTDKDGFFTASNLQPGEYFVRPIPKVGAEIEVSPFSDGEFKIVDRDFEASFWPGGSAEPQSTVVLGSGGAASVGVIKLRTISDYRVHVSLDADCTPGPSWRLDALNAAPAGLAETVAYTPTASFPCMKEILIKNVKPGSYQFAISNEQYGSATRWAVAPIQVTRENLAVSLRMSPASEVRGRIVTVDGAVLPPMGPIQIRNFPALIGLTVEYAAMSPDPDGTFVFRDLPWPSERIVLSGLSSQYYVKEIRAGGAAAADGIIPLLPGAPQVVEIVLDDQAATLTGTVMQGDKPADQALVMLAHGSGSTAKQGGMSAKDGTFQVGGLAPGEYRLMAIPASARISVLERAMVDRLLITAVGVKLERGSSASVILKLTDPAR